MPDEYVPPGAGKEEFHCPHCNVYAHQHWRDIGWSPTGHTGRIQVYDACIGKCVRCDDYTMWVNEKMIYPKDSSAPFAAEDMPDDVKSDFSEARHVVNDSPRAAAALLRLAIEKLAKELTDEDDQTLNSMIGTLVKNGDIDTRIQRALDSVRVIGNESVHPGELNMDDDSETALKLFELTNIIVELTITRERLINETFNGLPENKLDGIENRDS